MTISDRTRRACMSGSTTICRGGLMSSSTRSGSYLHRAFLALTITLLSLTMSGCTTMYNLSKSLGYHKVHTETFIEAQPEDVWAVITDAPNYRHWNPVITNAEGTNGKGATIRNTVVEDGKKPTLITSKVMNFDPPFHLNQFGGYPGIITFDHHYILEPVDGGTKVTQKEEYTGIYVHFWDSAWVETAYRMVNTRLREEVLKRLSN